MTADVIPFVPASGAALIEQARQARVVPVRRDGRSVATLPRAERLRAVAGVAQIMLAEAREVLALIAAGETVDGPLSAEDVRDLARLGLQRIDQNILPAMIDDIEAIHGR